jgi:hypothetical protein
MKAKQVDPEQDNAPKVVAWGCVMAVQLLLCLVFYILFQILFKWLVLGV